MNRLAAVLLPMLALLWIASSGCPLAHGSATQKPEAQKKRLLVVFAHPDDETIVAPLLVAYARRGVEVHLVVANDGQEGVMPHAGIPAGERIPTSRCTSWDPVWGRTQLHHLRLERPLGERACDTCERHLGGAVSVRNAGQVAGKEVVQLYVTGVVATVTPPEGRLRRFAKIFLKPGETKTLRFMLGPQDFSYIGTDRKSVIEPGEFLIAIGGAKASVRVQ